MNDRRLHVLTSIGTRLAIGAYPLVFVLAFGWIYGRQAFAAAAAANNWASYLNILLLAGFVLVPPAVVRLRDSTGGTEDRAFVRNHIALKQRLLLTGTVGALALWAAIGRAFPALGGQAGAALDTWYLLFAVLALAQLPLMLWLGVAQAAGRYRQTFVWVVMPRGAALVVLLIGAAAGAGPTSMLAAAVAIIVAGQLALGRTARRALDEIDERILRDRGYAAGVLAKNLSAGAIGLVGTLVTIVPVTIVGRLLPSEVGQAHVIVALSNAVGAVVVAAFFPLSLTLAEKAHEPNGLWRHCVQVARGVAGITTILIVVGWLAYPACSWLTDACTINLFTAASLVAIGAGLRLGALGAYHAAVYQGHPHYSLLSATAEAIAVTGLTWWLLSTWKLYALGAAFVVGGALRLLIALGYETRLLTDRAR